MIDFESFKEDVKNRSDIVDIVSEFVDLKKKGTVYLGLCPFHNEKTPSFNVNRERQFYHCFGCGKGGDVYGFLMDITGMTFMESLEQLSERAGLKMPEKLADDPKSKEKADFVVAANTIAAEYYHKTLYDSAGISAMEYLTGRGLSKDTIRSFRLGFAPEDPDGLLKFAKLKSLNFSAFEDAGILRKSSYGGTPYNHFGNRIIFPIIDQTARIIGLGGRILSGEGAKYVNSPESPVYHKSKVFYGLYQARDEIKKSHKAVVVEGYMDVISMHQAGFKNVIAASGTALTQDHGRIISRLSRSVTLLFDGDNAGISAVSRGADNLVSTDLEIGVCVLPPEHDPDSYVKEFGFDSMKKYLDSPMTIWDFKLKTLSEKSITSQERLKIAGELAETISLIPDDLKRDVYIHDICLRTGIDRDAMKKAVDGRVKRKRNISDTPESNAKKILTEDERGLLGSIIQYPELARHYLEEAGSKSFNNEYCRLILDVIYHRIIEGLDTTPGSLIGAVDKPEAKEYIASSAMIPIDENTASKYIEDHLRQTKIKNLMAERKELHTKILKEKDPAKTKVMLAREAELTNDLRKFNA